MDAVAGLTGELVDRLLAAVNCPEGEEWAQLGWDLVFCIGGRELDNVEPYTPAEPARWHEGGQKLPLVSREEFFSLLRRRLLELIESGVREDFLVRALRNELIALTPGVRRPSPVPRDFKELGEAELAVEQRWRRLSNAVGDAILDRWLDEAAQRAAG